MWRRFIRLLGVESFIPAAMHSAHVISEVAAKRSARMANPVRSLEEVLVEQLHGRTRRDLVICILSVSVVELLLIAGLAPNFHPIPGYALIRS